MYSGKVVIVSKGNQVSNSVLNFISDCVITDDQSDKFHLEIDSQINSVVSGNKEQVRILLQSLRTEMENKFEIVDISNGLSIEFPLYLKYADLSISTHDTYYEYIQPYLDSADDSRKLSSPLILIPDNYTSIDNIVLMHDGSDESLYTIKTFCNVFESLIKMRNVTLLNFNDETTVDYIHSVQQVKRLVSYLRSHCKSIAVHHFKEEDPVYLKKLLGLSASSLVVQGNRPINTYTSELFESTLTLEIRNSI